MNNSLKSDNWMKYVLIFAALILFSLVLLLPLFVVLAQGFAKGFDFFWQTITEENTLLAFKLTFIATGIAVPLNTIFGISAAWLVTKYDFKGKQFLITLIDLPFSISPIIAGLIYVILFGAQSIFFPYLQSWHTPIAYAIPGIVLTTIFVSAPFVARELIPIMTDQGTVEEEAAAVLGANGWQTFFKITLPNIKWALLHGVILCTARTLGEFGAVSVISGHIRGMTVTLPLQIEILYNDYQIVAAFSVAILLLIISLCLLMLRHWVERHLFRKENA